MKNFTSKFLIVIALFFISAMANAQLAGVKNIPGDYATITEAVGFLNAEGVGAGGVTFNVAAGHTETITAPIILTATGTLADQIIFQKNGVGNSPLITAHTGTNTPATANHDDIWRLVGSDYVTIDGIDLLDPNTTNPASMEGGYVLYKASLSDGAQNNTIQNCVITMNRINNASGSGPSVEGSRGIEVTNATPAAAITTLVPTTAAGTNSYNKFYSNTIQNANYGIVLSGYAAGTPFTAGDTGNDIGAVDLSTGNTILNYGGAAAATNASAGIRANNQWSVNISYNTVNNNDGAGVNHVSTLRGIYAQAGTSANATINNNTVTVKSGATTSACAGIENAIGSTAAGNTISISNNDVTGEYLTATTGLFYGIFNTASAATVNITNNNVHDINYSNAALTGTGVVYGIFNNVAATNITANTNTIQNISRTGTTGGTIIGIYFSSGTTQIANNNTINNLSTDGTGTASIIYGIQTTGTTVTCNSNTVYNLTCLKTTGTGAMYGVYNLGSPTNESFNNNEVYNLTHNGTGIVYGMFANTSSSSTVRSVFNNKVYTISGAGTIIAGMAWALSNPNIYQNKIYDIQSTSSGSPLVSGIIVSSVGTAGTANIYNNLIGDLKAPNAVSAGGADNVRGINLTATTTLSFINVYYNTVYLNATSSGAEFSTSGIYHAASATSTTAALTMQNNIIVNNSVPNGTGLTIAYRRSVGTAGTLANYAGSSNNNLFYAGTPDASRLIYYDVTSSAITLSNYKTGVFTAGTIAPRDNISVTENPSFLSTTGSNAGFLHINPAVPTQIESGAITVGGITDDFDADVRDISSPDIGADEFAGTPVDINGPAISYTNLGSTSCLTDRTLSPVTITDPSDVNITPGTRPRLYFKKSGDANTFNDNTSGTDGWKYVEASGVGDTPFSFTTNYGLLFSGAPVLTDIIEYFVVAQDMAATPNVGINSGSFAAAPTSVALTAAAFPIGGTPASYTITPTGVSGTVNVGAGETFKSLTEVSASTGLFANINANGLSGNTTVVLMDASISETGAVALNQLNASGCGSGPYTLLIKPNSTSTLTGSVNSGAIIKLNGADNVTIDGSNSGGTDRSLTITNMGTTAPTAISLISLGVAAGATDNTIKNCNISSGVQTTIGYGISVGGSAPGTAGADNDNNSIQNNNITNCAVGIYAIGTAAVTAGGNDNLSILENSIGYNGTLANVIAIRIGQTLNSLVSRNTVNVETTASVGIAGISLETGANNTIVSRNLISKVRSTNTGASSIARGIVVGTALTGSAITIRNNVIYNVLTSRPSSTVGYGHAGIFLGSIGASTTFTTIAGGVNLYHNSVYLSGNYDVALAAVNYGLYVGSNVTSVDCRNNAFQNSTVNNTQTSKSYSIYSVAANTAYTTINNNDYFVSGTQGVLGFLTSDRTDLAGIQSGFGQNINSLVSDPTFNSNTNLIPQPGSPLLAAGDNTTGTTIDYLGTVRGNPPTIGAYEQVSDASAPAIVYSTLSNTCSTGDILLSAGITDGSGVPTSGALQPRVYFRKNAGAYTSTQGVLASGTGLNGSWNFTISASAMGGVAVGDIISYYVIAQDVVGNIGSNPSAGLVASDVNTVTTAPTTPNTYTVQGSLSGTYTVGSGGNYITITAAVNAYNNSCLTGPVVFELLDVNYSTLETFPVSINSNIYANSTNTLTIKPATTISSVIEGSVNAGSIIKLNGADYVKIWGDNGTAKLNLTIRNNTTTTTGNAAIWLAAPATGNGSTNNQIVGCIIEGNSTTTSQMGVFVGGNATISTTAAGLDNNNNNLISDNLFRKSQYGLYLYAFAAITPDNNNIIRDNNFGTATAGEGFNLEAIHAERQNALNVSGNLIQNVRGSSGTNMYGIRLLDFKSGNAFNNAVFNCAYTGTGTAKIYGVAVQSVTYTTVGNPSASSIYNNLVYGINSSGTSAVWNLTGMFAGQGYGDKYYFNSIHLSGQINNSSTGLSAAFANGDGNITTFGTNFDLRNNIFSITGTSLGGNVWAYYSRATNLTGSIQDNNSLRAAGTGATNNLAYLNSISYTTLAAWQSASSVDGASLDVDPMFNNDANLQLQSGSPLVGAGDAGTGINEDITGFARNNPPTIGAYEEALDGAAPAIVYTNLTATCSTSDILLTATLTDLTGVPTSGALQPRIYFRKNANPYFSTQGSLAAGNATNGTWSFTISVSAMGGVAVGDIISYYVIAQDVINNIGSSPSAGLVASDVNTVTTAPTTPNTYNVQGSLGGTYTVGSGGNYPTITAAVNAYNNSCLTSAVVFELLDASYTGETLPMVIDANPFASGTNMLTIRPATGVTTSISGTSTSAVFKLNGADFVTIDGSNNSTTSRDMTIINTSVSTNTAVIWLSSLGAGAGASNNIVKNTIIEAGAAAASNFGIQLGGLTITTSTTGADNNINTIENNHIRKVGQGIYARGVAATGELTGLIVKNNIIGDANSANYIRDYGMNFASLSAPMIEANEVFNLRGDYSKYGIFFVGNISNARVNRNKIHGFSQVNTTSTYYAIGIYFSSATGCINNQIDNNAIYDLNTFGSTSTVVYNSGIKIIGGSGYKLYFNTVSLTAAYASAITSVISSSLSVTTASTNMDIRNNIFLNTRTGTGTTPKAYGIYTVTGTTFTNIDNNDYYNGVAPRAIGYISGAEVADLAALQTATTMDANSIAADPLLNSDIAMQPLPGSPAISAGDNTTGITIDILEFIRANPPTMGAYEVAIVLPITVEYFRGSKQSAGNLLDWKVSCTGSPYATLVLERSADGRNFKVVNSQEATALRCLSPFNFTDVNALAGINFYRLKMIDADGKISYSHIVALLNTEKGYEIVSMMPNPAREKAILTISSAVKTTMDLVITDINGKQLSKQRTNLIAGSNQLPLNLSNLAAGSYQVTAITAEGVIKSLRFIKQ